MILTDNPFREAVKQWGQDAQMGMVAEEVVEVQARPGQAHGVGVRDRRRANHA